MNKKDESKTKINDKIDFAYVLEKYESAIGYYWQSSGRNKKAYKNSRSLTIALGASVTLISSISSASFISGNDTLKVIFAIITPIIAAILTIIGGFSNSFHWGATWRDMVINAVRLEKERDIFLATDEQNRDIKKELEKVNSLIVEETDRFFQRVLDSEVVPDKNYEGKTDSGKA